MGGLQIGGTESEVAAQVEAQVHVRIGVGGRATDLRQECAQVWVGGLQIAGMWMGYG